MQETKKRSYCSLFTKWRKGYNVPLTPLEVDYRLTIVIQVCAKFYPMTLSLLGSLSIGRTHLCLYFNRLCEESKMILK